MARRSQIPNGSWLLAEDLLEQGDLGFLDEFRRIHDADRLRGYAKTLFNDKRQVARESLLAYFDRPLNAYRHEGFVKATFKLAEDAGDSQLMGRIMVAVDRSVRRQLLSRHRYDWSSGESWVEQSLNIPAQTQLPREDGLFYYRDPDSAQRWAAPTKEQHESLRLFSVATRQYLRRRAWRYFRNLGKQNPDRYVDAVADCLIRYDDQDVQDGVALLDNWGLMHILFHGSDQIVSNPRGWRLADDGSLGKLKPAPAFETLWQRSADPLLKVLGQANSRPVRQWAMQMLTHHHPDAVSKVPVSQIVIWLSSGQADMIQIAVDALEQSDRMNEISVATWLEIIEASELQESEIICGVLLKHLQPASVSFNQALELASARPVPVARLGLKCLETKSPENKTQCHALLTLCEAPADSVRPALVNWLRDVLGKSEYFETDWIIELLDAQFEEVRAIGWHWLLSNQRAREDTDLWQKLLETPYDDVRLKLVDLLQRRRYDAREFSLKHQRFDATLMQSLWASVLLNIHRGGRQKERVVNEIVTLLSADPSRAKQLLPLLAVALRSVRSTEWRSGLSAVVTLVDQHPEIADLVEREFPELRVG